MLPSASGMPAMPMKLSALMSAIVAFTSAATRASSATFTFSIAPSRVLSDSIAPSAFSIWPRIRAACCAKALVASTSARPAPIKALCDNFMVSSPGIITALKSSCRDNNTLHGQIFRPAIRAEIGLFLEQIGLDQSAEFRRHFRLDAKPALEAAHRLLQQHAKPVGRAQALLARRRQQPGDQRGIDQIRHHHRRLAAQIDLQRRLTDHAERRGIDQKSGAAE